MCKVLIVDDESNAREVLAKTLEHMGNYDIREAANVKVALEVMESWRPDVVLLDLNMPMCDGVQFLQLNSVSAAIVVVTGQVLDEDDIADLLEAGASWVLTKPVSLRVFMALVNRITSMIVVDEDIKTGMRALEGAQKRLKKARGAFEKEEELKAGA